MGGTHSNSVVHSTQLTWNRQSPDLAPVGTESLDPVSVLKPQTDFTTKDHRGDCRDHTERKRTDTSDSPGSI